MRITQTILAAVICTWDKDMGALEGTAAGRWSVGLVEQSRARSAVDFALGDSPRECEGGDCGWK